MPTEVLKPPTTGGGGTPPTQQQPQQQDKDELWKQDVWTQPDGSVEAVVELEQEPRHCVSLVNDYVKLITIRMSPGDTTLAHRHCVDTVIVICMPEGVDFVNNVMGCAPAMGRMEFQQIGFAPYTSQPCIHKITNLTPNPFLVVNLEITSEKNPPPLTQSKEMQADHHVLVKQLPSLCRIYKLSLEPDESCTVDYAFFYVRVVLSQHNEIQVRLNTKYSWEERPDLGECDWKEPCLGMTLHNVGETRYEAYICELI